MTARVREVVARAAAGFDGGVKAALFTTFTFDPGFFEANVLPLLFGIDTRGAQARRAEVNTRLAGVPVAVFYDDAALNGGGSGEFRYQTWPVHLPGAGQGGRKGPYFHPKLILLAGEREQDGRLVSSIYLSCGSANLTLSGWGHNVEVLGESWITGARAPAHAPLQRFLRWLGAIQRRDRACPALDGILRVLDGMTDSGDPDAPELHVSGIGAGGPSLAERLRLEQSQTWDWLTVHSPYWSGKDELPALVDAFRAKSVKLVPGISRDGRYGLQPEALHALRGCAAHTWTLDGLEPNRLAHAKLYAMGKERGNRLRVAIGSCNMTLAAQQVDGGNVEAMLIHSLDLKKDARLLPKLRKLDLEKAPHTDETDEPPDGVPFNLTVVFDWRAREYAVWFSGQPVVLHLPGLDPLPLGAGCDDRRIPCPDGPGKARGYRAVYTRDGASVTVFGLLSEINLDDSARAYTPPLSASDIIEELRERSSGLNRCLERLRLVGEDEGEAAALALRPAPPFNLYDFYAAVHGSRWRMLKQPVNEHHAAQRIADLVGGPSALLRLARAVAGEPPVHRFAVALEVHQVLHANVALLEPEHLTAIDTLLQRARADVAAEIEEQAGSGAPVQSDELLAWFEAELTAFPD